MKVGVLAMRMITFRVYVACFILIGHLSCVSNAASQGYSERRTRDQSDEYLIRKTLSDLVFAVRHRLAGQALSCFISDGTESTKKDKERSLKKDLTTFCEKYKGIDGLPIVYLADIQIINRPDDTRVSCVMIWQVQDDNGRAYFQKLPETFFMTKVNKKYCITKTTSTQLLFKHINNPKILAWELEKTNMNAKKGKH